MLKSWSIVAIAMIETVANYAVHLPVGKSKSVPASRNAPTLNMARSSIPKLIQETSHLSHEVRKLYLCRSFQNYSNSLYK